MANGSLGPCGLQASSPFFFFLLFLKLLFLSSGSFSSLKDIFNAVYSSVLNTETLDVQLMENRIYCCTYYFDSAIVSKCDSLKLRVTGGVLWFFHLLSLQAVRGGGRTPQLPNPAPTQWIDNREQYGQLRMTSHGLHMSDCC